MIEKQSGPGGAGGKAATVGDLRTRAEGIIQAKEHVNLGELPHGEVRGMHLR